MKWIARFRSWLRAAFHRSRLADEMDTELRFHIESYAQDLMLKGIAETEASRRARMEFGSVVVHKQEMQASLGLRLGDELRSDIVFGLRMLRKSMGFSAIAVLSLALGIGANSIIFLFAKQVLLQTLAVPHPEQLRLLSWVEQKNGVVRTLWGDTGSSSTGFTSTSFSYPVYQELRRQNTALQDLFAFKNLTHVSATIDGHAQVISGELVSGNYYQELGIGTVAGRPLVPADDRVAAEENVAVISDAFWARAFGRSPEAIGKKIGLNLTPFTIIGVNSPSFTGAITAQVSPDVFVPISAEPRLISNNRTGGQGSYLTDKDMWWVLVMARLKPGVAEQTARASLNVALDRAVKATMSVTKDMSVPQLELQPGNRGLNFASRQFAKPTYVLLCLVGLVLLLACANLANLLLARSAVRQKEMSVRLALGATRNRIFRQVFTESLLLSLLGGAAGLFLGFLGRNAIPRLLSNGWEPASISSHFDWKVCAFTAALALLTGILFGLAPAMQATRADLNLGLKDNSQTATGSRKKSLGGKALVVFQVSLSMLLVTGAGLFVRTLLNLNAIDLGFQPHHLLLFSIEPPSSRYPAPRDILLHEQIEERLATFSGIDSVALSSEPLLANSADDYFIVPDDQRPASTRQIAYANSVSENFLSTMHIPLLRGRQFNSSDTATATKVAIVNQALVAKIYPDADPIGRTFTADTTGQQRFQIIGVCADARYYSLRDQPPPTFYMLYRQLKNAQGGMTYEVRSSAEPAALAAVLRNTIHSIDKDLAIGSMRTQVEQIDDTMKQERIFACLTTAFGALALTLACIGIYGLMAYTVSRRMNEFGLRLALGAQARQIMGMVLKETSWLVWTGIAIGLASALWLTRFLVAMVYGLKPSDAMNVAGAALLLFATAMLAGWIPALKASRVQPLVALRHE